MAKTAVITGITGQDGAYLAEHLLGLGYKVIGAFRRTSSVNFWRLAELGLEGHEALALVEHDLTDLGSNIRLLQRYQPDEIYNLAAQSYVAVSFTQPFTTASITGSGPLNVLEAIRLVNNSIRFYQASSSEQYGKVQATPQDESTAFYPRSPYAAAKLFAHWLSINYREAYGLFAVTGILFNHESPLRGKEFVTRKITDGVARIKLGMQETLELGNLNALRDWGFAREYVQGMHLMMQHHQPDSFVLATGRNCSVRQFVVAAFDAAGMKLEWKSRGADEVGVDAKTGKIRVRVNPAYFRPAEVDVLLGNPAKAKAVLGWEAKTTLEELARHMVDADVRRNKRGLSF